jgi:hypothetical protein
MTRIAAQSADSSRLLADVLPWLLVLIGVIVVGGVIIYYVRRSLYGDGSSSGGGFTLQDLRDMHASGELSDEQFERARAQMIGRLKGEPKPPRGEREPEHLPPTGNHDATAH